jgi:hypothetical protein
LQIIAFHTFLQCDMMSVLGFWFPEFHGHTFWEMQ